MFKVMVRYKKFAWKYYGSVNSREAARVLMNGFKPKSRKHYRFDIVKV